ncbi:MAG: 16S rRNA (cytosine(1402)-N(4))-methyltransferase RsmH [Spirochaetia bacterium]|nr:16S rRNA (cytosine(1402)-N(4))-methyltransferase RsmH [Spirochaetia bacterium]
MQAVHYSVLKQEVITHLVPVRDKGTFLDCTMGEGGHSEAFLSLYPHITVVGIDRDPLIQKRAKERLSSFDGRVFFYNAWFDDFLENYPDNELQNPDLILFDLGISLFHYEDSGRGFSFSAKEPLDMRLNSVAGLTAADILNTFSEKGIADIIYYFGEERYSRRIARAICESRYKKPIRTADELREIVFSAVPSGYRHGRIHPATKTFQALRIEVNGELNRLHEGMAAAVKLIKVGGRIGIITFHSLEDRIVKHYFQLLSGRDYQKRSHNAEYYKDYPLLKMINKKPITASREEIQINKASRSAKLRIVEKIRPVSLEDEL